MAKPVQATEVFEEEIVAEEASSRPHHNAAAAIWTIVCGVALPCIPIIVISIVLLYIVFHYQIIPRTGWQELQLQADHAQGDQSAIQTLQDIRHHGGHPAYYVQYNPSTITTIAAWTGRVIPYLSSSIMALVAFFAARRIVTKSRRGNGSDLPTPEQLTLLIGLLGGSGFGPLKDTVTFRLTKKQKLVDPVPMAFYALLLITSIGLIIPMVDTWFGIATTPTIITQLYNTTSANYQLFGRSLSATICPDGPGSYFIGHVLWMPCGLQGFQHLLYPNEDLQQTIVPGLRDAAESTAILQGSSKTNIVLNHTSDDGVSFFYLADQALDTQVDFKAHTFAVSTTCKPVTKQCIRRFPFDSPDLVPDQYSQYSFDCGPGFLLNYTFNGAAQTIDAAPQDGGKNQVPGVPLVGLAFAPTADFTKRVGAYVPDLSTRLFSLNHTAGTNWSYSYVLPNNPLNFMAWGSMYPSGEFTLSMPPLLQDPNIVSDSYGAYWILECEATVYDVQYTWVNGSERTFNVTPASPEMGGLISGPFAFSLSQASIALGAIANIASLENTADALANSFALGWSKAAIALSIGALAPSRNEIEQIRNSTVLVARVPMIPLYLLLGFKALYVLAVIVLAISAYCFTHPAETEVVKAQLSTKGLAAAHFDTPNLLQQNVVQEMQKHFQLKKSPPRSASDYQAIVDEGETTEYLGAGAGAGAVAGEKEAPAMTRPVDQSVANDASPPSKEKKVGVVAHADGAWKFAVVADGVWSSIKPIAVNLIESDAKKGGMGKAGEVIAAWA